MRDANYIAHVTANHGVRQDLEFVVLDSPSPSLATLVLCWWFRICLIEMIKIEKMKTNEWYLD